jgi:SAM-dependent methyltransferase
VSTFSWSCATFFRGRGLRRTRGRVDWACARAVPFPAEDGSADLLLCASTLHFLGVAAFADWARVLRRGGIAAFTLPWGDRFRPGPPFAGLLPSPDRPIALPRSAAEVAAAGWPGFDTVRVVPDRRGVLFVVRKP